jgi:DNA-binding SARP family transcriptional activator
MRGASPDEALRFPHLLCWIVSRATARPLKLRFASRDSRCTSVVRKLRRGFLYRRAKLAQIAQRGGRGGMSDPDGPAVRFEVLGPLRAWRGNAAIDLGPVQQQVVFAVLLLQQNRAIARQQLINAVWGEADPSSATNLVQRHVSALRQALELSRHPLAVQLVWTNAGYVLTVPAGGLDLEAFDRYVDMARKARAAGDLASAAETLRIALRLWRGPLCDGLTSPFLDAQRDRLEERRISIVEECIELEVSVGDRDDLVSELRQLVTEHAFRERMHGLLMLALYRSGRRADALAAFHEARRTWCRTRRSAAASSSADLVRRSRARFMGLPGHALRWQLDRGESAAGASSVAA